MPADDSFDRPPLSPAVVLTARYPGWTIWYGQATRHWWALPPRAPGVDDEFIEAPTVKELVESIEAIRARPRPPFGSPGGALLRETGPPAGRRIPAAMWPGAG